MKKLFTYFVVATTIVWSLGIATVVPAAAAYSPSAGDLIKTSTDTAVYYIGADGNRHLLSNLVTFRSWNNKSWSSLVASGALQIIAQDDFDTLNVGANITARPGVNLIKFDNSPKVYAVTPGAKLAYITNDAAGAALYGSAWKSKIVVIQSSFETNYSKTGADLTASSKLPDGSLIKYAGNDAVYYISNGMKRLVTDEAFVSNGFFDSAVVTVASSMTYDTGESLSSKEAAIANLDGGATSVTPPAANGTLNVALAATTPASTTYLENTTRNAFTKFTVTAGSDGAITINSWQVKRVGIAQDADFAGVNIVDDTTNQTISPIDRTFNTDHIATFTNKVTVAAGTSRTYTITGTMAASLSSGNMPALQLSALTLGNGTLSGSLPITGNTMSLNGAIATGIATIARGSFSNSTTTSSAATKIGELGYTIASLQITDGSVENIQVEQIKFYEKGSASLTTDLANIKLYNALTGDKLADGVVDGSYVWFNFTTPLSILKGNTEQIKVTADVISGSDRTIQLAIYRNTDILVKGTTNLAYTVPCLGTLSGTTCTLSGIGVDASGSNPIWAESSYYIGKGTYTVARSNAVTAGNIAIGSEQTLGALTFDVKGEALNVTALTLAVTSSTTANQVDALTAVRLVDASGNTVAGPTDHADGSTNIAWTDSFTIPVGTSVYKVMGKINSNKGWSANDTIYIGINAPSTKITATGGTTGQSITSDTTSNTTGNTQTVKDATLVVTRNSTPGTQTVVVGTQGVRLGAWTLDATGAGEDIRITQLVFAGRGQAATNTTNLKVLVAGSQVGTTQSAISTQPNSTTFTFSSPIIVTKGTQLVVELQGDKTTVASDATEQWGLVDTTAATNASVVVYGKDTGVRATVTSAPADDGATVTSASAGTMTVTSDGAPASQITIAGTSMQLINKMRFVATNADIDVTKMTINIGDGSITSTGAGTYADFKKVYLKSAGSFIGSSSGYAVNTSATTVNLNPGTFFVPKGSSGKVLEIYVDIATIGTGTTDSGTDNDSVKIGIAGGTNLMTAIDTAGNAVSATPTATSSAFLLHKSKPVVTHANGSVTSNVSGDNILDTVNITATDGDVAIYRLTFLTTTSTHVALTNGYLQLSSCSSCTLGSQSLSAPKQITALQSVAQTVSAGESKWSFALDNQDTAGLTQEALVIPQGATAVINLRATIDSTNWSSTTTRTIVTAFLGDATATTSDVDTGDTAVEFSALNQGNFVWSDLYSDSIGADVTTTAQWFNGFLISGANEATSSDTYTRKSY